MRTSKWILTAALLASIERSRTASGGATAARSNRLLMQPAQACAAVGLRPIPLPAAAPRPDHHGPGRGPRHRARARPDQVAATRTPVVETYLQNLTPIRNWAPRPARTTISSAAWTWAIPSTARTI